MGLVLGLQVLREGKKRWVKRQAKRWAVGDVTAGSTHSTVGELLEVGGLKRKNCTICLNIGNGLLDCRLGACFLVWNF